MHPDVDKLEKAAGHVSGCSRLSSTLCAVNHKSASNSSNWKLYVQQLAASSVHEVDTMMWVQHNSTCTIC